MSEYINYYKKYQKYKMKYIKIKNIVGGIKESDESKLLRDTQNKIYDEILNTDDLKNKYDKFDEIQISKEQFNSLLVKFDISSEQLINILYNKKLLIPEFLLTDTKLKEKQEEIKNRLLKSRKYNAKLAAEELAVAGKLAAEKLAAEKLAAEKKFKIVLNFNDLFV